MPLRSRTGVASRRGRNHSRGDSGGTQLLSLLADEAFSQVLSSAGLHEAAVRTIEFRHHIPDGTHLWNGMWLKSRPPCDHHARRRTSANEVSNSSNQQK